MESSTFTIRCPDNMETNWSIQLYPKGAEEDSSDFLSIFLQSETEDIDIDAKCNFSILDVSKIKRNKKVGEWDLYDEVRAYYGFDEFIRIDSLGSKAARLLPNDSLTIALFVMSQFSSFLKLKLVLMLHPKTMKQMMELKPYSMKLRLS